MFILGSGDYKFSVHEVDFERESEPEWDDWDFKLEGVTKVWKVAVW